MALGTGPGLARCALADTGHTLKRNGIPAPRGLHALGSRLVRDHGHHPAVSLAHGTNTDEGAAPHSRRGSDLEPIPDRPAPPRRVPPPPGSLVRLSGGSGRPLDAHTEYLGSFHPLRGWLPLPGYLAVC